jgi:hypothetical protein
MTNPRHGILGTRSYRTKKGICRLHLFTTLKSATRREDLQTALPLRSWP